MLLYYVRPPLVSKHFKTNQSPPSVYIRLYLYLKGKSQIFLLRVGEFASASDL